MSIGAEVLAGEVEFNLRQLDQLKWWMMRVAYLGTDFGGVIGLWEIRKLIVPVEIGE